MPNRTLLIWRRREGHITKRCCVTSWDENWLFMSTVLQLYWGLAYGNAQIRILRIFQVFFLWKVSRLWWEFLVFNVSMDGSQRRANSSFHTPLWHLDYVSLWSEIAESDTKLTWKEKMQFVRSGFFLRAMCFSSRQGQRCRGDLIMFLLLTSSAQSVEQLHHCLAAVYQTPHHRSVSAVTRLSRMRQ